jgi:hypothetical protein
MMRLCSPSARPVRELPRGVVGHFRRQRFHGERGGMFRNVRIRQLVVAVMAAKFIAQGRAVGENRGAIKAH